LGTIARSGTAAFVQQLSGDKAKDLSLIGQFGVGFYSAFMVADKVEVLTRRAGEAQGWRWVSEGRGEYLIAPAAVERRGTRVVLHLRPEDREYLEPARLREVVRRYSDHIALPIVLVEPNKPKTEREQTLNAASALWMRPKAEISEQQYKEFYRHAAHTFDDPWATFHWRAEGKIEYTALLFVPSTRPFDIFHPDRKHRVKLYVRRVFITDSCEEVVPAWLRFLRGIVDSEDLPLNISREMLQKNPLLAKIRQGVTRRVLGELQKKAEADPADFMKFWDNFGAVLKEGLYEDAEHRDAILTLARFRSTAGEAPTTLAEYVARMRPGQEAIYTLSGDDVKALAKSPHLEGFAARGVEVLLLTDPVDEFWIPAVGSYEGKPFKSVTRGAADLEKIVPPDGKAAATEDAAPAAGIDSLVALFRLTLKDAVKDVRTSQRLTDSPVCLVADEGDIDIHLERLLKQHRQIEATAKRVLEINPRHPLIAGLARRVSEKGSGEEVGEAAWLLLDQARIVEGDPVPDAGAFSRRLAEVMRRAYAA
ncbi:MAG: molecular chaperone HtpG, partial [Rhodospirillaceae bacterium]|nr:molecular chaperone HtpG [Rhodospirillaceae bacterium]